jgi:hypothetical protein
MGGVAVGSVGLGSVAFGSVALDLSVAVLVVGVLVVAWCAVEFALRSRRHARRPWLPADDRPPVGLRTLRPAEVPREVEAGLATLIGYLRRRALHG